MKNKRVNEELGKCFVTGDDPKIAVTNTDNHAGLNLG